MVFHWDPKHPGGWAGCYLRLGELEIAVSAMAHNPCWLTGRGGKNSESDYAVAIEKRLCEEARDYFPLNHRRLIVTYAHMALKIIQNNRHFKNSWIFCIGQRAYSIRVFGFSEPALKWAWILPNGPLTGKVQIPLICSPRPEEKICGQQDSEIA
jgi:hypothetical protein